jgi:hypothetical protein
MSIALRRLLEGSAGNRDSASQDRFGLAPEIERDDLSLVDTCDTRDSLGHDDFPSRRNALQPRRGVDDVADRGEVADLALADDPDVRRADVEPDAHLQLRTLGVP